MEYAYILSDVFTDRTFGGNQLAVLLESEGLTPAQMQAIAAEFNLSETAFLGAAPAPDAPRPLRIFTPKVELPFAGHPTVGTALAMAWAGLLRPDEAGSPVVFQEGAGPVEVRVAWRDGVPETATLSVAGPLEKKPAPELEQLASVLGLSAAEIGFDNGSARVEVESLSAGVPFTLVPVRNREALARAQVDLPAWQDLLAGSWAPHLYVFTDDAEGPGVDVRARMFAPAMGIAEDPATGAAASALAGYLAARSEKAQGTSRWVVEQGIEMGRPSRLEIAARVEDGAVAAIEVGGGAVKFGEGRIRLPAST